MTTTSKDYGFPMKWIICALILTVATIAKAQAVNYGLGQDSCPEFVAAAGLARTGDPSMVTGISIGLQVTQPASQFYQAATC